MNDPGTGSTLRCLFVWATTTGVVLGLGAWATPDLPLVGDADGESFDRLLVRGCALALVLCAGWWWSVTTIVVLGALRGATHGATQGATTGVPAPVRRWVLAACGVAVLSGGLAPAHATPGPVQRDDRSHTDAAGLEGLPLPERPTGGLRRAGPPPGEAPEPGGRGQVVVRPGDSLWEIAATALGPGADALTVSAHWQRIHELNRDVVGADPDLIRPGQHLLLPDRPAPPRGES